MKRNYAAQKLRDVHVSNNIDGTKKKSPGTARAITSTTQRLVRSNFESSIGKKRSTVSLSFNAGPTTRGTANSQDSSPSPGKSSFTNPFTPNKKRSSRYATEVDDPIEPQSTYECSLSTRDLGVRRLLPSEVFGLHIEQPIIIVIPLDRQFESDDVIKVRNNVKAKVAKAIKDARSAEFRELPSTQLEQKLHNIMNLHHIVIREDRAYCEFPAHVTSFPHRDDYAGWSSRAVDAELRMGASIGIQLDDYYNPRKSQRLEIRLDELHSIELWIARDSNNSVSNEIHFPPNPHTPESLVKPLMEQLDFVYGDTFGTYEVMYKYYRAKATALENQLKQAKGSNSKSHDSNDKATKDQFVDLLKAELNNDKLDPLVMEWDKMWHDAIVCHYRSFQNISDALVGDDIIFRVYRQMEANFPMHIEALMNISTHDLFFVDSRYDASLHEEKKRICVHTFFALTRARNKNHMIHWALIETMAIYGKGINQITTRSVASKNFCCKLSTAFEKLDAIYEKCAADIRELIQRQPFLGFDMDNYNRIIQSRYQIGEKSAITHIATASSIVRQKMPALPIGSTIRSPLEVIYRVLNCERENPYELFLEVEVDSSTLRPITPEQSVEVDGMHEGKIFPEPGWQVIDVPGLENPPPIVFINQTIPPMLLFTVNESDTDNDLLFHKREFNRPGTKIKLGVDRYHSLLLRQQRIIDLCSYKDHLKRKGRKSIDVDANEADPTIADNDSERYDHNPTVTSEPSPTIDSTTDKDDDSDESFRISKSDLFVEALEEAVHYTGNVYNFHSDMVRHANPEVDCQDQIYLNKLHANNETSNEGALKAMINGFVDMEVLKERGDDDFVHGDLAEFKTIFFHGDLLTDIMAQKMRPFAMKRLTRIGFEDYVETILTAIDRCVFEHDYMHETFHMMAAIYDQFWGGFLQPLCTATCTKRVSGKPLDGGKIIDHHNFLMKVYKSYNRYRIEKFIEYIDEEDLEEMEVENGELDLVVRIEELYEEYCNSLEHSDNEQTKMVALFMKAMESYIRCKNGIRKGDALLLEKEVSLWIAMWKIRKKDKYLAGSIRRTETLYGMKPWELEVKRRNRFPRLNLGRGALTFDELNELHNWWLKQLPVTPYLTSVVDKSKHLSFIRRCAVSVFGRTAPKSSTPPGEERDIEALMQFHRRTSVFVEGAAVMEENTFWKVVQVSKKSVNNTKKGHRKETVDETGHEKRLVDTLLRDTIGVPEHDPDEFLRLLEGRGHHDDETESVNLNDDVENINLDGMRITDEDYPTANTEEDDIVTLSTDEMRDEVLKKLGNSKHQPMDEKMLEDGFETGQVALKDIVAQRAKERAKLKKEEAVILKAVSYFKLERDRRRAFLKKQINAEKSGEINNFTMDDWELDYLEDRILNG